MDTLVVGVMLELSTVYTNSIVSTTVLLPVIINNIVSNGISTIGRI